MLVKLSTRYVPGVSKADRQQITHFLRYVERKFTDLPTMLTNDYIYSPFPFLGYKRGTEYICGNTIFCVLDVDTTTVSVQERYQQLVDEGLNFIIATTSDIHNMYKYRILFPLDREVDQDEYRLLIRGIEANGLVTDLDMGASVKAGGFFFSYKGAHVVTHFTGSPLGVSDYALEPDQVEYANMGSAELLDTFEQRFSSYRYAQKGKRTSSLFSVAFTLREAGCSYAQIETGVLAVNSMFLVQKPVSEIHRRVLSKFKGNK